MDNTLQLNRSYSKISRTEPLFVSGLPQSIYKDSHMCIHSTFRASPAIQPVSLYAALCQTRTFMSPLLMLLPPKLFWTLLLLSRLLLKLLFSAPAIASMSSKSWWCIFFSKYLPFLSRVTSRSRRERRDRDVTREYPMDSLAQDSALCKTSVRYWSVRNRPFVVVFQVKFLDVHSNALDVICGFLHIYCKCSEYKGRTILLLGRMGQRFG